MSKIKLVESGGMMGSKRSAEDDVNMSAAEIKAALTAIKAEANALSRDGFTYSVFAEGVDGIAIDPNKAKGKIGRILKRLMDDLTPMNIKK
ncbi:MAG: hypothetical protein IPO83_17785 [Chitinophagaceae bacterium]|nr:hypothetical protein [Chitinophagaceae bacterium]